MRGLAATVVAILCGALATAAAAAEPSWRLEQPPPPDSPFAQPLGAPGDLKILAPNRVLLSVAGTATVPRGLYTWDGESWRQLATVCGASDGGSAIAVAGPSEFWTITEPSRPRAGIGTSLCHFKDGNVIASYSTPAESPDPYRQMAAAACRAPNDCWFGGFGTEDLTGDRRGAFHLHWDGSSLTTVYAPQGRGVSDLESHQGELFESVVVGRRPNNTEPVDLFSPEDQPRLIHRIEQGRFLNDAFLPAPQVGLPADGSELLALDSDGTSSMWAGGGGAASGPSAPVGTSLARPPLVARLVDGAWQEVTPVAGAFDPLERIVDIAAVPGSDQAWAAVTPISDLGSAAYANVARIAPDGSAVRERLPVTGAGRGAAAKIAFASPTEGWMVTTLGWIFHFTDGTPLARDTDPAYSEQITFRPNEAAEQFVPDAPPADDSELFKPPPVEIGQAAPPAQVRRLSPLLRRVRASVRGRRMYVRFQLTRRARVSLVARRKGRIVARTKARMLRRGRHTLVLKLDPKRWPQRLSFSTREPGGSQGGGGETGGGDGDVVTTGR